MGRIFLLLIALLLLPQTVFASSVTISEVVPHPSSGADFIVILNPTPTSVDLTNWTVSDGTGVIKTLSGSLNPDDSLKIEVSNRLNNSGDSVILKNGSGEEIDSLSYSSDPGVDQVLSKTQSSPIASPSTSGTPTSNFSFTTNKSDLSSTDSLDATITLSNKPNTTFYIKGAFYKSGSTNYFGLTKVSGSWVKNSSKYSDQLKIQTDSAGNFSGNLEVMPDSSDSGFSSSGTYQLKIAKYTDSGDLTWSNSQEVSLTLIPPSASPSPTPKSTATAKPTATASPRVSSSNAPAAIAGYNSFPNSSPKLPEIAGASTQASSNPENPQVKVASDESFNWNLLIGRVSLAVGTILLVFLVVTKKFNIAVKLPKLWNIKAKA
jgi:hypothetical protein